MSGELVALVVVAVVVLLGALLAAYLTAHRLDRLHIRTDLARASLVGALGRRHMVGTAIARELADGHPDVADRLSRAVVAARAHPPEAVAGVDPTPVPDRRLRDRGADPNHDDHPCPDAETSENRLGVILAGLDATSLPVDLAHELNDAADRVAMARRFYNDAVRDTRSLREKRIVRVLRLAGRAPMPDYVELVDAPPQGG